MKIQKFVVGYVLALALLLFAQQRPATSQPSGFREVADLTHSLSAKGSETPRKSASRLETAGLSGNGVSENSSPEQFATRIEAPALLGRDRWTVDQIPAGRLIGPLVVLDVTAKAKTD